MFPSRTGAAAWALLALALLLVHGLSFHFVVDDAFISFRYAQNLVDGHGLVFNPGEAVEGYSNLLWVLLIAAGLKMGIPAPLWARILGAACALGALLLLPGIVRAMDPGREVRSPWAGRISQVATAATGAVACWTLAGLETPLFGLLIVWAWREALGRSPLQAGVAGLLLVLTRPEGPALAVIFLAWSLLPAGGLNPARSPLRSARAWAGPAILVAGTAAFFLWRHATYGWWLPNTYYAKTGDLQGQLATGLPYGLAFLAAYLPVPALLTLGVVIRCGAGRLRDREVLAGLGLMAFWWCYVVVVGGDMLGMYRFFAPILPVLVTWVTALAAPCGWFDRRLGRAVFGAARAAAMVMPSFAGHERRLVDIHMSEDNLGGWMLAGDAMASPPLNRLFRPGTTLALGPAGYIPWRTGLVCYDFYGLVDPRIAHKKMAFTHHYAGHEKHDADLVLRRRPDYILLGNVDVTTGPRQGPTVVLDREMDIAEHPVFKRDYVRMAVPIGGDKYLNLFQRKDLRPEGR